MAKIDTGGIRNNFREFEIQQHNVLFSFIHFEWTLALRKIFNGYCNPNHVEYPALNKTCIDLEGRWGYDKKMVLGDFAFKI